MAGGDARERWRANRWPGRGEGEWLVALNARAQGSPAANGVEVLAGEIAK